MLFSLSSLLLDLPTALSDYVYVSTLELSIIYSKVVRWLIGAETCRHAHGLNYGRP